MEGSGQTHVPGFWSWNGSNSTVLMSAMIAVERGGRGSEGESAIDFVLERPESKGARRITGNDVRGEGEGSSRSFGGVKWRGRRALSTL